MNFKMIGILSLILVAVLAMSAVCAAEDNATDEIISVEDMPDSDAVSLDQSNDNQAVEDESNQTVNSDGQSNDVLGVSNDEGEVLTISSECAVLGVSTTAPAKLSATATQEPVLKATNKKTTVHYVKVGKYKGKLTTKQYNVLKTAYKKNNKCKYVTIKSTNKKYHKITIQYFNGYNGQNGKYYKKGFYATVWDTRYGLDGTKIVHKRVKI